MVGTGGYRSFLATQSRIQSVSTEKLGLQGLLLLLKLGPLI